MRGKPWVLLFDPVTQRFHRVTPQVHEVLELLDGRRTLDEVWDCACERAARSTGEAAVISQHELVQLLSSLHANDLLQRLETRAGRSTALVSQKNVSSCADCRKVARISQGRAVMYIVTGRGLDSIARPLDVVCEIK